MRAWVVLAIFCACGTSEVPVAQTPFRPRNTVSPPTGPTTDEPPEPALPSGPIEPTGPTTTLPVPSGDPVPMPTNEPFVTSAAATLYSLHLDVPTALAVTTTMQLRLTATPQSTDAITAGAYNTLALSVAAGDYFVVTQGGGSLRVDFSALPSQGSPTSCGAPENGCTRQIVPAPNGTPNEAEYATGCPPGMDSVADFCIDRFEAMVVAIDGGAERTWSPYANPGSQSIRAKSVPNAIPQGYINRTQAAAACAAAGKRLCTSTEWLRACQGSAGNKYPYGNTRQPGVCNDARSKHPAVEYFATSNACVFSNLKDACINQLTGGLGHTGAHAGCRSADGPLDMMGNLHEWVSDDSGSNGIFRGGFYVDTVVNGEGCLYKTTAHAPSYSDYSTGFRCCATP